MSDIEFNKSVQRAFDPNGPSTKDYEVTPNEYQKLHDDLQNVLSGRNFTKQAKFNTIKAYMRSMELWEQRLGASLLNGLSYDGYRAHVDAGTTPAYPNKPPQ